MSKSSILSLSTRPSNCMLFLGTPTDEVGPKKNTITYGRTSIIRTPSPVSITISM
ncbi:hypothetical protein Hanom_Chr13g01226141 [Helianthus anomalus]